MLGVMIRKMWHKKWLFFCLLHRSILLIATAASYPMYRNAVYDRMLQDEFDEYLKTMKIYGLGGTDFRPVFEFTQKLIDEKEFTNLKGLIYFTDGYGDFPAKKPDFDAAFVFIDDEYNNPDVPPWAIKLVLQKDEI